MMMFDGDLEEIREAVRLLVGLRAIAALVGWV
jgi:hypothetical protein